MTPNPDRPSPAFAGAFSNAPDVHEAATAAAKEAASALGGSADLAVAFVSPQHVDRLSIVAEALAEHCDARNMIGCGAETVVAGGKEFEQTPAVSVWLAKLPDVRIDAMTLQAAQTPEGFSFSGWTPGAGGESLPENAVVLLLGDPFTFPVDALLQRFNEDAVAGRILGGMASAAMQPGENRLLLNGKIVESGAVAVRLQGAVSVAPVVSQGCRPIGRPFVVTKAENNLIFELGGKPVILRLQEVFDELSPAEQNLLQRGLHVGRVIDEYKDAFDRGDFLIRNVLGADDQTGAIGIGDVVRPGQTIQFHLRDAASASEDLKHLLTQCRQLVEPKAALLFTCNGRGSRMFDVPSHDAAAIQEILGDIPTAGFFAAGEIGPVGGKHFLHGFTASIAVFS